MVWEPQHPAVHSTSLPEFEQGRINLGGPSEAEQTREMEQSYQKSRPGMVEDAPGSAGKDQGC